MIERVVGEWTVHVEPLGLHRLDGGPDDPDLLVAEEPVFSGMGVQRRNSHAWRVATGQRPHGPVGQPDLGGHRVSGQKLENLPQGNVQRHVDHSQAGPAFSFLFAGCQCRVDREVEHHRVVRGPAALRENLRVAGMRYARQPQRLLGERERGDGVDPARHAQVDRGDQEVVSRAAGTPVEPSRPARRSGGRDRQWTPA